MQQRILFAEDEPISRKLISMFLRREGYEVEEAKDGAQALDLLNNCQFDLVISDIRLPRVDGIAVITRLRSIAADTPFIVLTSYPDDALDLSKMPKSLIMSKPVIFDNLKSNIQRLL
ncbi:MAG: response regulator [Candidatus Binatia bacterium]